MEASGLLHSFNMGMLLDFTFVLYDRPITGTQDSDKKRGENNYEK